MSSSQCSVDAAVAELCKTSAALQDTYRQLNGALGIIDGLMASVKDLRAQLGAADSAIEQLRGEREVLGLLVSSFQFTTGAAQPAPGEIKIDVTRHSDGATPAVIIDPAEDYQP